MDLPVVVTPTPKDETNYEPGTRQKIDHLDTRVIVDSDYANNTTNRRSVTGTAIKIAAGAVFDKTNFQNTIALSSTEAEFIAAYDAARVILYIRSILDEINILQDKVTTLYENIQGALLMPTQINQPNVQDTWTQNSLHFNPGLI